MLKNTDQIFTLASCLALLAAPGVFAGDRADELLTSGLTSGLTTGPAEVSAVVLQAPGLTVYKTPTCGCCGKWVDYMEDAGFNVTVRELRDMSSVKRDAGLPPTHQSCHTAIAADGGYVFEGHIPAKFVKAFLAEPPAGARGLVVPAMPVGSPGMEYGNQFAPYDVFLLKADGAVEVYARVNTPADARD